MEFQTFGRTPKFYEEIIVDDSTVVLLKNLSHNYCICQFQEIAVGDYAEASRIVRYKVDGTAPTLTSGFIAGDVDSRIFTKGELKKGVNLLSAEAGKSFLAVIEYYDSL